MEAKTFRNGMTDRIRAAAEKPGDQYFSRRDIYYEVDPDGAPGERSFSRSWEGLRKRGEIVRVELGKYRYESQLRPVPEVRRRIYRAMHVKGAFCAADIRRLTDADSSYILTIIRRLARAGDLELTGKKGKTKVFRVRHPEKFYLELVK